VSVKMSEEKNSRSQLERHGTRKDSQYKGGRNLLVKQLRKPSAKLQPKPYNPTSANLLPHSKSPEAQGFYASLPARSSPAFQVA